ncbi:olfactory receptor 14K1-like [Tachyglossus aculeatus]|uniref:olfactory receptor 14K1-like n=1 Tax=Tachyglossus aculeatus TaxID=9261 RepID=UPI0018F4F435|nr:olfactory receptor 14K1-like [Tachyglossus aculeatus]
MPHGACVRMLAASWFSSCLNAIMYTASTFSLSFCGPNTVHQIFCDGPQLLRLACSTDHVPEDVSLVTSICLGFFCFVLIVGSYVRIFSAVLRITSVEGRSKAFSTCVPHLVVVALYVTSAVSAYLKPISDSPSELDLLVSVCYAVVPPTLIHIAPFLLVNLAALMRNLLTITVTTLDWHFHVSLAITICLAFFFFVLIMDSYVRIFSVVLRVPSAEGSPKAFST